MRPGHEFKPAVSKRPSNSRDEEGGRVEGGEINTMYAVAKTPADAAIKMSLLRVNLIRGLMLLAHRLRQEPRARRHLGLHLEALFSEDKPRFGSLEPSERVRLD